MTVKKPGAFDAPIRPLFKMEWVVSLLKACRQLNEGHPDQQKWIEQAIRVLEAAAKVDKDELNWALGYLEGTYAKSIRALLDTLPDGHPQSGEPKEKR